MIGSVIEIALGYFLWSTVPGMICQCPKKLRLVIEIIGILLMIAGGIGFLRNLLSLF